MSLNKGSSATVLKKIVLKSAVHCILLCTVFCCTLYFVVHCILLCTVFCCALYFVVHCILLCTVFCCVLYFPRISWNVWKTQQSANFVLQFTACTSTFFALQSTNCNWENLTLPLDTHTQGTGQLSQNCLRYAVRSSTTQQYAPKRKKCWTWIRSERYAEASQSVKASERRKE
jgi:hypothetical protein